MRLIDIDSQFIASLFPDHHPDYQTFNLDDAYDRGWEDALDNLEDAPTISAVPVVRCKNCKHFNLQTHECENELLSTDHEGGASYSLNFYDDDFCSYGEWREADHEVSEL